MRGSADKAARRGWRSAVWTTEPRETAIMKIGTNIRQIGGAMGGSARTFLTHLFGRGLDDEKYRVERYRSMADGMIRPWHGVPGSRSGAGKKAGKGKGTGQGQGRGPQAQPRRAAQHRPGAAAGTQRDHSAAPG